jgi:hypothetical protein
MAIPDKNTRIYLGMVFHSDDETLNQKVIMKTRAIAVKSNKIVHQLGKGRDIHSF